MRNIKTFESFNKSEFSFREILQNLRDDFEIDFYMDPIKHTEWQNLDRCIDEVDKTHDMYLDVLQKETLDRSPLKYGLIINNEGDNKKSYSEIYPYIEEVADRFEEKNMYIYSVMLNGFYRSVKYVSLPDPEEKSVYKCNVGEIYPTSIKIVFKSQKRKLEPTTKIGKFIDKFRDKNRTRYTEYTSDTGPG